jgi:hypothetical protein
MAEKRSFEILCYYLKTVAQSIKAPDRDQTEIIDCNKKKTIESTIYYKILD